MIDMAHAMPQSLAPFAGAWLPTVAVAGGEPDYGLLLGAAAAAVAGAFVVLPVKKAK